MGIRRPILTFTLLLAGVILGPAATLRAGIAVSPLKQEISLRPGESGKLTLTLTNNARTNMDPTQSMRLDVVDVQISEDGGLALPPAGQRPNSASRWITLGSTLVTLEPGKGQTVDINIAAPPSAQPGEYYSAVLVTLANTGRNDKGLVVQYRVASGVFLTILGRTFPKQARISRADWIWPEAPASQPAASEAVSPFPTLAVMLQNTGQVRFDGSGRIIILNDQMRTVFRTALTSPRPCVFGGDNRRFEAILSKPLPPGKYTVRINMDYESSWTSARQEFPIEILPDKAAAWARIDAGKHDDAGLVETTPAKVASIVYAGGTRSVAIAVSNISDGPIHCSASLPQDQPAAAWLSIASGGFAIVKSGRRSIELQIAVPPGAAAGKYAASLALDVGPEGGAAQRVNVPVELEVRSEK